MYYVIEFTYDLGHKFRQLDYTRREIRMAYVINENCVQCGACAAQCPAGAIAEGDGKYEINADACIDCGGCADGCPADAIAQA